MKVMKRWACKERGFRVSINTRTFEIGVYQKGAEHYHGKVLDNNLDFVSPILRGTTVEDLVAGKRKKKLLVGWLKKHIPQEIQAEARSRGIRKIYYWNLWRAKKWTNLEIVLTRSCTEEEKASTLWRKYRNSPQLLWKGYIACFREGDSKELLQIKGNFKLNELFTAALDLPAHLKIPYATLVEVSKHSRALSSKVNSETVRMKRAFNLLNPDTVLAPELYSRILRYVRRGKYGFSPTYHMQVFDHSDTSHPKERYSKNIKKILNLYLRENEIWWGHQMLKKWNIDFLERVYLGINGDNPFDKEAKVIRKLPEKEFRRKYPSLHRNGLSNPELAVAERLGIEELYTLSHSALVLEWARNVENALEKERVAIHMGQRVEYTYLSRLDEVRDRHLIDGDGKLNLRRSPRRVFETIVKERVEERTSRYLNFDYGHKVVFPTTLCGEEVHLMKDTHSVIEEGVIMRHCVGMYFDKDNYLVFHVGSMKDPEERSEGFTIGVDIVNGGTSMKWNGEIAPFKEARFQQAYGLLNKGLDSRIMDEIRKWVPQIRILGASNPLRLEANPEFKDRRDRQELGGADNIYERV